MVGNDDQIDFSAVDPILCDRLFPELISDDRASNSLNGEAKSTSVESLALATIIIRAGCPLQILYFCG